MIYFQVGDKIKFEGSDLIYQIEEKNSNTFFGVCITNRNFQFYYTNESLNSMGCEKV